MLSRTSTDDTKCCRPSRTEELAHDRRCVRCAAAHGLQYVSRTRLPRPDSRGVREWVSLHACASSILAVYCRAVPYM